MNNLDPYSPDPEVEIAFDWFKGFLGDEEWEKRKESIDDYLETVIATHSIAKKDAEFRRFVPQKDRSAWYLYQVFMSLYHPWGVDTLQAARVVPVFKKLGRHISQLRKIDGIDDQITRFFGGSKEHPDQLLFEVLVALVWKENDWKNVAFIPPSSTERRPDIKADNGRNPWFIETKRMMPTSGYSREEREKWLRMWRQLSPFLTQNALPLVLDIVFHEELKHFDDDFLLNQLRNKLPLVTTPCDLIKNEKWEVSVWFVDFEKINAHLARWRVKNPSQQLIGLIGGKYDRKRGFTHAMECSTSRVGDGKGMSQFVDEISWAAGGYWHCDAESAIEAKARDIRSHLSKAVSQLPDGDKACIHVGLETIDGEIVEAERYQRILNTVARFDVGKTDLRWIHTHLYQSYAPPDKSWVIDETIYTFNASGETESPIPNCSSVVPNEMRNPGTDAHWLITPP